MRLLQYVSMRQVGDVGSTRRIGVCRMQRRSSKSRRSQAAYASFIPGSKRPSGYCNWSKAYYSMRCEKIRLARRAFLSGLFLTNMAELGWLGAEVLSWPGALLYWHQIINSDDWNWLGAGAPTQLNVRPPMVGGARCGRRCEGGGDGN
jgi:hypothetical protein